MQSPGLTVARPDRAPTGQPGGDNRTVADVFAKKQSRLLPPPLHAFSTDRIEVVRSPKTIYVRLDLNDYSIPPEAVGRQ